MDGAEALDYLYQRKNYKTASLPDIVILDMILPKIDGMTILETIKEDINLMNIPVIIFGTSSDEGEIRKAYESHANCYIVKPVDYDDFNNFISFIEKFWINRVRLPTKLRIYYYFLNFPD